MAIPIPTLFKRGKEPGPLEQTYSTLALLLHFGLTSSAVDQVASMPLRGLMAVDINLKRSIKRFEEALLNADLTPSDKRPFTQNLTEEEAISKELSHKITQDLQKSQQEVLALPTEVLNQVEIDLNLMEAPDRVAKEADISAQLLADKKKEKEERQQQKEQDKLISAQSKEFCKSLEKKKLEEEDSTKTVEKRIHKLDQMSVELEEKAKPKEVEVETPKQVPADYLMAKELERLREEPSSARTPGLGDDSFSE